MALHISIPVSMPNEEEIHYIREIELIKKNDRDSTIFCVVFGLVWIILLYNAYLV